jgi:hypothetical protein
MSGTDSARMAEKLFGNRHSRDNPAIVEVSDPRLANELTSICNEFGIIAETVDS